MATEGQTSPAALAAHADMLDVLVRLHDRELDSGLLTGLGAAGIPDFFLSCLRTEAGRAAATAFGVALSRLPDPLPAHLRDDLAAEYADIHLTHGYRAAPNGSVWLTEDRLERQLPMFAVREWYAHYDITVPDWRRRADDHLVHELQFVSLLCRMGGQVRLADAGRFLDDHVLSWVPDFIDRLRPSLQTPFYRAVAELTLATLEEVRTEVTEATGLPRAASRVQEMTSGAEETAAYLPGVAESW